MQSGQAPDALVHSHCCHCLTCGDAYGAVAVVAVASAGVGDAVGDGALPAR